MLFVPSVILVGPVQFVLTLAAALFCYLSFSALRHFRNRRCKARQVAATCRLIESKLRTDEQRGCCVVILTGGYLPSIGAGSTE